MADQHGVNIQSFYTKTIIIFISKLLDMTQSDELEHY